MAGLEFRNPRRDSPYTSCTKHINHKVGKPLVWQDDMAEIRETYRRVAKIKDTAYTGFSCLDPARTAEVLSKNRKARKEVLHSFEQIHYLNSSSPFEAFQHVRNVRNMCRRIQSISSLTERKKNPWDVELFPALLRRPTTACPVRHPRCHRGCGPTRPVSVPVYTDRTPKCYAPASFSQLLDISNKPESTCHACHYKAPYDRPSQQDKSPRSRAAYYHNYMLTSGPSSPSQESTRFLYDGLHKLAIQHTETPASTNVYMHSYDDEDTIQLRSPPISERFYTNNRHYETNLSKQATSRVLIEKPLDTVEKKFNDNQENMVEKSWVPEQGKTARKLVERRYPIDNVKRGQSKSYYTLGSSSLEHPSLDNANLTDRVLTDSDSSSETEKVPPRRSKSHGSRSKVSLSQNMPRSTIEPRKRSVISKSLFKRATIEKPLAQPLIDKSSTDTPSIECCSPRDSLTLGLHQPSPSTECKEDVMATLVRIDGINDTRNKMNLPECSASDSPATTMSNINTIDKNQLVEDLEQKKGFYETGESGVIIKHSTDPYVDFKNSMMEMIAEEKLENRPDAIEDLFQYYLDLNPGAHHQVIERVIIDIRKELKAKRSL